jgi:copper oxidase (laccase) domain-containing protein
VTDVPGAVLSVFVADCAPVVLRTDTAVGIVHAGWRGLVAGVMSNAVAAMRRLSPDPIRAVVGPCIGPECYEFGVADLDAVAGALGIRVRARTTGGRPALDLREAVHAACDLSGVVSVELEGGCTACGTLDGQPLFSHRARGDAGRQVGVVWLA